MKSSKVFIFKFFIIGFAIFMIIGIALLIFLDKYYLVDSSSFRGVLTSSKASAIAKVSLPQDVQKISFSSDGNYVTYIENNKIQVVDLNSGEKSIIASANNMNISYYKWVADRDRLILAEKSVSNKYFKLYYYDVINKNTAEISDAINQSNLKITANGKSDAVTDIQMSPLTNLFYIKMTNSKNTSHFYKIDIMAQGGKISLPYSNIGTINLLMNEDKLIFENSKNNRIYLYGRSSAYNIDNQKTFKILGSDNNDIIYLAESDANSNVTSSVYYGNNTKGWSVYTSNLPVNISDIYVMTNGEVYVNDNANSILYGFNNSSKTKYSGKFIGVYSQGVISLQNNEVLRTKLS